MSEWHKYIKDPRSVCRYGSKCYQKNPDHIKKYKHPPINSKRKGGDNSPAGKRHKPSPRPEKCVENPQNTTTDEDSDEHKQSPKAKKCVENPQNTTKDEDDDGHKQSLRPKKCVENPLNPTKDEGNDGHKQSPRPKKCVENPLNPTKKEDDDGYKQSPRPKKCVENPLNPTKEEGNDGHKQSPRPKKCVENPLNPTTNEDNDDKETASPNQSAESSSLESRLSHKDESSFAITLPENLTYHDKDDHTFFKKLFLVDMPDDFFKFYECLLNEPNILKTLGNVNLELIGPFELLLGKLPVLDERELYLVHWRFFYDPPEFQAVLKKKGKSEYHIGYYRDAPNEAPVFLAHNDSAKGYLITPMASNIFGAVYIYLQNEKKTSPFVSVACQRLMEKVKSWAEKHNYSLEEYDIKKRLVVSVTKTIHGAGITAPYNKKTQLGYRKLVETDANIKKLFTKLKEAKNQSEKNKILSEIQPVITYANIAVDECDFGTGLECGIDLFCSGIKELQPSALASLQSVYTLLNREEFGKIIEAHIKYRRKGPNMSILSLGES